MKTKLLVKYVSLIVLILLLSLLNPVYANEHVTLNFASGMAGGGWFLRAGIFSELVKEKAPNITLKVLPGAGLANPTRLVSDGDIQVTLSFPPIIKSAFEGTNMYEEMGAFQEIRGIAKGWGTTIASFTVPFDSNIQSLDEIFEKKRALNWAFLQKGSLDEFLGQKTVEYYGVTYDDLKSWGGTVSLTDYSSIAQGIIDGQIDIAFGMLSYPAAHHIEIMASKPIRLLDCPQGLMDYLVEKVAYEPMIIPKGTYEGNYWGEGEARDIQTAGVNIALIVHKDVSEEVAYTLTKIINDNTELLKELSQPFELLNPETNWQNVGAPLHLGAERYYREIGVMK